VLVVILSGTGQTGRDPPLKIFPEKKRESAYAGSKQNLETFFRAKGKTCRPNTRQLETNLVAIQLLLLLLLAFLKKFGGLNDHHADLFRHEYLQRPPGRKERK
jgi:hypothetical protein